MVSSDLAFLLPELVLVIGACALLLAPLFGARERGFAAGASMLVTLALTAVAIVVGSNVGFHPSRIFSAMFVSDGYSIFFKLLFTGAVAMVALLSEEYLREQKYSAWEYYSLLAFGLLGSFFMVSGMHLISIWIGLELLSISSYILAGYYKHESQSTEAAMKYFVLGAVSSGILLYGFSLIYGVTGSLGLIPIRDGLAAIVSNDALIIGIALMAAGFSFKVAAAPFHVWTPDVYVGSPTPVTAFLSTASKAAAFAAFARIFYMALGEFRVDWTIILSAIAALSMVVGNVAALTQTNIKRMLAYSSVGHAGYGLMGIIAGTELGVQGILVYMLVYVFATLGIWAVVLMLRNTAYAGESIDDFQGLHARSPFTAFAMIIFLLSLGGIPPTAGFIGKYFLFASAVGAGFGWLAVVAVLTSAISMFYYLRVVVAMYLKDAGPGAAVMGSSTALRIVMIVALVVTLAVGVLPQSLITQAKIFSRGIVIASTRP